MRKIFSLVLAAVVLGGPSLALAGPEVGKAAPAFSLTGLAGKPVSLADYKGKTVVLEWLNKDCPFVRHYYKNGDMQALQKKYTDKKVVWLSIVSSADGREGYFKDAAEAAQFKADAKASMTDILLDPEGKVGQSYGAKTTPDMYIVSAKGVLVYSGAIDDKPSTNPDDAAKAKNWVAQGLDEILAKKKVSVPETRPYGCSVKYKD
jgi:peroxiredoxin